MSSFLSSRGDSQPCIRQLRLFPGLPANGISISGVCWPPLSAATWISLKPSGRVLHEPPLTDSRDQEKEGTSHDVNLTWERAVRCHSSQPVK
jgi:hypothetical protein